MNWNSLLIRHGWLLKKEEENVFDCTMETKSNIEFLMECLDKINLPYTMENDMLVLPKNCISEEKWLSAVNFENRGRGEGLWFRPSEEEPKIRELDTYISGVVRQLNRLGFYSMMSCDGHGRRLAHIVMTKESDMESLSELLLAFGLRRVYFREQRNGYHVSFPQQQEELLNLAESLVKVDKSWIEKGINFIKEQLFQDLLEELLDIQGMSGREGRIREVVKQKLTPYVDHLTEDDAGNLLAMKTYRNGNGPTILLNAHLDIYKELEFGRKIIKEGNIWSSDAGILGADDRAGIAILLHLAEHLANHSSFDGKIKFIFTVKEEVGLVGARQVADYFLWGTDAAIVVDRRGEGDIVTSCGGYLPFCHPSYGAFFEETAAEEGFTEWLTTKGGSSDTRIWVEHGIQSVNLSAGYQNEHTESESLNVEACYETANLIKAFFHRGRGLRKVLREINRDKMAEEMTEKVL